MIAYMYFVRYDMKIAMRVVQLEHSIECMTDTQMISNTDFVSRHCLMFTFSVFYAVHRQQRHYKYTNTDEN